MKIRVIIVIFYFLLSQSLFCQNLNTYSVYALEFAEDSSYAQVSDIAVNAPTKDSVKFVFMIWLLKGNNGKNILVDAGFERNRSVGAGLKTYIRPDSTLSKIGLRAEDITDIIITHPHWDHIDGINLFPNAIVWMQKADYEYFVGQAWQKNGVKEGDSVDVIKAVQRNISGKLELVNGDDLEILPGIKVYIGSKHTFESQYLVVNTSTDKVLIASDNIWFYYNLKYLVSIPLTFDQNAYINAMKRMKTLVNPELIIPGHDEHIFTKFKKIAEGVVQIR